MYTLKKVVRELDDILVVEHSRDEFYDNGLVVEGRQKIKKVGLSVDLGIDIIKRAIEMNVDMLITHNGLIYKRSPLRIRGNQKKKMKMIMDYNMNIYVAHMALDLSAPVSSNTTILKKLGARYIDYFGPFLLEVAAFGEFDREIHMNTLINRFKNKITPNMIALTYGPEKIRTIAVCTPPLDDIIYEAAEFDALITTTVNSHIYSEVKDHGMNVIFASEHELDRLGILALMNYMKKRLPQLEYVFLEEEKYLKITE